MKNTLLPVGLSLVTLVGATLVLAGETPAPARKKSVSVYPIAIRPAENVVGSMPVRIAEVVGLLLERAGMEDTEIVEETFPVPETDDVSKMATAFGQFIKGQSLKTEFALFVRITGTPKSGISEIHTIVVDKDGKVIFAERADQAVFSRGKIKPTNPMTASVFVANHLRSVWDLDDPLRKDAPEGKMAQRMKRRSGMPSDEELAAMRSRMEAMKGKFTTSTVAVNPVHLWKGSDKAAATALAKMLHEQGICQAESCDADPRLQIKGDPNEQKVLWDTARAFREFVRRNPPDADFALLADYGLSPSSDGSRQAGHVHLILCNRAGDWVMVDFQNSHHRDFQDIAPKSCDDCNRLAVKRVKARISQ